MEVTIRMVKKCGSGGGQSIQLSVRRREIFEVTPVFRLHGAPKRRFGATAAGGFNAASRRIASANMEIHLFQRSTAIEVSQGFGRDARNNPRDAGATNSTVQGIIGDNVRRRPD
jgi:hypothetical protein